MAAHAAAPDGATTLSGAFLDWWFAPWLLTGAAAPAPATADSGPLAVRLAYRPWCEAAGVPANLPAAFDGVWQQMAVTDGALLRLAAQLYGGVLAARAGRRDALARLPLDARRWCLATASTQPLTARTALSGECERDALQELALLLEQGLPGMWARLRLLLPDALPAAGAAAAETAPDSAAAARRRLRCWGLCLQRARQLASQGDR